MAANINGDNIDDLFRQASDQYPLRTDSSDWNKLARALEADPSLISPVAIEQGDKRRRKRFLWLLLLLPLGGLGYYTLESNKHARPKPDMANTTMANGKESAGTAVGAGVGDEAKIGEDTKIKAASTTGTNAGTVTEAQVKMGTGTSGSATGIGNDAKTRNNEKRIGVKEGIKIKSAAGEKGMAGENARTTGNYAAGNHATGKKIGSSAKGGTLTTEETGAGQYKRGVGNKDAGNKVPGKDQAGSDDAQHPVWHDALFSRVNGPNNLRLGDFTVNADVRAPGGETQRQTPAATPKKAHPGKERHAIYLGIVGAPDLSTIHMQSVKGVGTTFGILGGYVFNPKWSLETGVYLDMKRYYTDGQYFSKKNVQPLRYVDLLDVNGDCNMAEIPVNLRYNLSSGISRKWFATAGLSTYLMSKEWYSYHYLSYGTAMYNSFTYRKPYDYLFSIVNLSLGYEQKLGKIGNLRLEPYLRIPLSGIGTGSLSIMSAGLNIGITRRIR